MPPLCREVPCLHADEITALRRAAAMAHTVAGIGITLRPGERILATVGPSSGRHTSLSLPAVPMTACTFRNAVAKAWTDHSAGQRVALVGQSARGLDVEWAIHQPGAMLGFGGVRTQWAERMVWAMASPLPPDVLTTVLDVSIVHVEAERVSHALVAAIDEVIRNFIATAAAAELLESLALT